MLPHLILKTEATGGIFIDGGWLFPSVDLVSKGRVSLCLTYRIVPYATTVPTGTSSAPNISPFFAVSFATVVYKEHESHVSADVGRDLPTVDMLLPPFAVISIVRTSR